MLTREVAVGYAATTVPTNQIPTPYKAINKERLRPCGWVRVVRMLHRGQEATLHGGQPNPCTIGEITVLWNTKPSGRSRHSLSSPCSPIGRGVRFRSERLVVRVHSWARLTLGGRPKSSHPLKSREELMNAYIDSTGFGI